jgi:cytochrome b subunit of formate dehydrogenase
VAVAFLCTGYIMSGRYGFGQLLDEKTALSIHKMLHLPLIFLLLVHSLAAMYLALERWGWLRFPRPAASRQPPGQKG